MTPADSEAIAWATAIYGLGLPAFVLQKTLQPLFFAREDTRSPFRYALGAMAVNAALAFGLHPWIGWMAPAVATTAAGWIMVLQLALGARRFGDVTRFDARFKAKLWRITLAALAMGGALAFLAQQLSDALITDGIRYAALAFLVFAGMAVYFGIAHLIGGIDLKELRRGGRS